MANNNPGAAPMHSAESAEVVTPSDITDLTDVPRAFYIGGAGDMVLTMMDGEDVTFVQLAAGTILPARGTRVKATGTTATNILALY